MREWWQEQTTEEEQVAFSQEDEMERVRLVQMLARELQNGRMKIISKEEYEKAISVRTGKMLVYYRDTSDKTRKE